MSKPAPIIIRTPVFRLSYANLVTPRLYEDKQGRKGKAPVFSTEMLFDVADLGKFALKQEDGQWVPLNISQYYSQMAAREWPDTNLQEAIKYGGLKKWMRKGDEIAADKEANGKNGDAYKGKAVINASSQQDYPPTLVIMSGGKLRQLNRKNADDLKLANDLFKGGNYAVANINVKPWNIDGVKRLTTYINVVTFAKAGDPLGGGGMDLEDRFSGIEGGIADVDPFAKADVAPKVEAGFDEIPF